MYKKNDLKIIIRYLTGFNKIFILNAWLLIQ